MSVDAIATAVAPGAPVPERLAALQKGTEGGASRADVVPLSPPNATMGVLPMFAGETDGDWVIAVVAANNFGPSAASIGDYVRLRDRQDRLFNPIGPPTLPQYEDILNAVQRQGGSLFVDRDLLGFTTPIQPAKDAFVLLAFHVAPDSEALTLVAR